MIYGLFWSADLKDGALPTASPFGDRMMTVEAARLFRPDRHKLYFADFYCLNTVLSSLELSWEPC